MGAGPVSRGTGLESSSLNNSQDVPGLSTFLLGLGMAREGAGSGRASCDPTAGEEFLSAAFVIVTGVAGGSTHGFISKEFLCLRDFWSPVEYKRI